MLQTTKLLLPFAPLSKIREAFYSSRSPEFDTPIFGMRDVISNMSANILPENTDRLLSKTTTVGIAIGAAAIPLVFTARKIYQKFFKSPNNTPETAAPETAAPEVREVPSNDNDLRAALAKFAINLRKISEKEYIDYFSGTLTPIEQKIAQTIAQNLPTFARKVSVAAVFLGACTGATFILSKISPKQSANESQAAAQPTPSQQPTTSLPPANESQAAAQQQPTSPQQPTTSHPTNESQAAAQQPTSPQQPTTSHPANESQQAAAQPTPPQQPPIGLSPLNIAAPSPGALTRVASILSKIFQKQDKSQLDQDKSQLDKELDLIRQHIENLLKTI